MIQSTFAWLLWSIDQPSPGRLVVVMPKTEVTLRLARKPPLRRRHPVRPGGCPQRDRERGLKIFSSITLRPFGPSVTLTALTRMSTPRSFVSGVGRIAPIGNRVVEMKLVEQLTLVTLKNGPIMDRPRRDSRQHDGIALAGSSQLTFAMAQAGFRHLDADQISLKPRCHP